MPRTTLLDVVEPVTNYNQAVNVGIALSKHWRARAANEQTVVNHISRVMAHMNDNRLTEAVAASLRIIGTSSNLVSDIELLAYIESTGSRISATQTDAARALEDARDYARHLSAQTNLPGLPELTEVAGLTDAQISGLVRAMSQLSVTDPASVARSLRNQIQARVRAHHAAIVLSAARRRGSRFPPVGVDDTVIRQRAMTLRDAAQSAALKAVDADATWFASLVDAVAAYERDWVTDVGDPCVGLLVAASEDSATLASRRTATMAYDAARLGLTWLAGTYELMLAWATNDTSALREWSVRAALPLTSNVLDLPRSTVSEVAAGDAPTGSVVEVAGIITSVVGERDTGRVRSVLRLDDALTIYYPFSAVDGFGVLPGVWCQIRGKVLDESKGGYPSPVVSVRRRPLGDAARASFNEHLEYQGRAAFDRMRAGDDAIVGRRGHDGRTANEAADWH